MLDQHTMAVADRLIGRDHETTSLAAAIGSIAAARSTALVLTGDAGSGKSMLLDWAARAAVDRGFTVISATGVEFEQGLAFSGLSAVLRPLLPLVDRLDDAHARALRGALGLDDADGRMLSVHGATLALVCAAAEIAPVLVTVDDAQWIDTSSLESLVFAAHRCDADPVGFVFTRRSGMPCLLDRSELPSATVAGLACEPAVALLGDHGVEPQVARGCWRLTRGNPLALVEAARALTPGQRVGDEPLPAALPIGDRLVDSFSTQVSRLPAATVAALRLAALDPDDDMALISSALLRVGGHPDDLGPAESAGVIDVADQRVSWRHPLVRAAVHHMVDPSERRRLHRALGEAATEAGRHDRALWHLSETVLGLDDTVAERLAALGAAARRRGAPPAAARAYEQAARLATAPSTRVEWLTAAADAHLAAGDHAQAAALLEPLADSVGDPVAQARIALLLGSVELWLRGPSVAVPRFEVSALRVRATDPHLETQLMLHASTGRLVMLDLPGAQSAVAHARRAAERSGDAALQLGTATFGAVLDLFSGSGLDAEAVLGPVGELAMAAHVPDQPHLDGVESVVQLCAYVHYLCDDVPTGIDLLRRLIHRGEAAGFAGPSIFSRLILVEGLWRTGSWAEALAEMSQLISLQQAVGLSHLVPLSYAELARIEAGLGHDAEARAHAEQALDAAGEIGLGPVMAFAVSALGLAHLSMGRWDEAAEALDLIAVVSTEPDPEPGWLWWHADHIEALARSGRTADAHHALDLFEAEAATSGRVWATAAARRSAALLGRDDPATSYTAAIEGFRSISAPFEEARTLLLRGEHLLREGARPEGARDLAAARTIFDHLGARPWSALVSAARGEAEGASPSLASRLTPAELRVAMAVGHGASNRQAAEQLFLSVKTVDFHLQGIYRKLGVRNRTQLAALVLSSAPTAGRR